MLRVFGDPGRDRDLRIALILRFCYSSSMKFAPLAALLSCLLMACSHSRYLEPPRPIPALAAPNQYAKFIDLTEACSGPWAVVFFYPEADTPG